MVILIEFKKYSSEKGKYYEVITNSFRSSSIKY